MKTRVEVYARGSEAELLLNGKSLGRKKIPADCRTQFRVTYAPGDLTAVVYDRQGNETARTSLKTAGGETRLTLLPETETVRAGELMYVRMQYTDQKGTIKPLARGRIQLTVKGGKLLAAGNACSYNEAGYLTGATDTYYGEALAVVQPYDRGMIHIQAESPYGTEDFSFTVNS